MKSFPKSEYWHFKISWKHCQENFQFSRRDFFGLQDFDISMRSYLTSCRDSQRGFGRLDFEISLRFYLKSCRDSQRVFGRHDFEISSRSWRESWRDFEISARSQWDLGNLAGQKLAEILRSRRDLGEISAISPVKNSPRFSPRSRRDLGQNFAGVIGLHGNMVVR